MSGPMVFPPPPPPPPPPPAQLTPRPFYFTVTRPPDEIIPNCLYLGGLSAALDSGVMSMLGITHILSVCPECTWDVPTHLAIHVDDTPDENILVRLPEACDFIQRAIDSGGKIFVHLMKSRGIMTKDALAYIKSKRPVARPNFGFIEQLDIWQACNYNPTVTHPVYAAWKRKHDDEHGLLLSNASEPIRLADKLYIVEDLPSTAQPLASFLRRNNITFLLTLCPYQSISMSESTPLVERCHLNLSDGLSEDLILRLPEAIAFIERGLKDAQQRQLQNEEGAVLVHSPTTEFTALMSLYEACNGDPSPDHPEILKFRQRKKEEEESRKFRGFRQNMDAPWIMWQPPAGSSSSHDNEEPIKNPGQSILRF
ncbi:hypothetical protein Clacol_004854 [Clathrus columnatus]|uniref:Tyrosine-protein phosphatase domain-containing protein n=1 Tax=Clathrus columnatus TaxID=1419009 RepID=A0AAV5AA99_9AGAM|nr:hypothetical protein Clacol_004854 [Clathrus columnatus]